MYENRSIAPTYYYLVSRLTVGNHAILLPKQKNDLKQTSILSFKDAVSLLGTDKHCNVFAMETEHLPVWCYENENHYRKTSD